MKFLSPRYASHAIVAAALLAAGCSAEPDADPAQAPSSGASEAADASEAPTTEAGPVLRSEVKGLRIVAASTVPSHPDSGADQCGPQVDGLRSAAAKAVQAKGWNVTGEAAVGGYDVVSFVGTTEQGTSGSCLLTEGNVGLFKGGVLKAIAYMGKGPGTTTSIGSLKRIEGNAIRILDGDFVPQPLADIRFADNGAVTVAALPKSDKVCGGEGTLPNIQSMPINKAHAVLVKAGWVPSPSLPGDEQRDDRAAELFEKGIKEAESCSGTGFGYCSFGYLGRAGRLSVTTVGDAEWPTVASYGVTCQASD
ncbi:hypothetical protein V474_14045 [Novosphingobium barchaimii LL02]|uniref:PASTA domain-containing protein n=1 Tax=Novosphingobium barchaimii LL02 TaxID=1114963 RepID=A0A0J7XXV7_9SPHN|nr:hypothetical protein [Novosphingobium barchaimii]KMS56103.1 hypothetical protein V474_14045 [Novosphingobium barchaimii LL02]